MAVAASSGAADDEIRYDITSYVEIGRCVFCDLPLYKSGPVIEISSGIAHVGCERDTHRTDRMRLSANIGPKEIEELLYLRSCGFTQAELGRCFNVHQSSISMYLRRIGDPLGRIGRRAYKWKEAA